MIKHIHIFGASGSGTTSLGKCLASYMNYSFIDVDDYYWIKTDPPFQIACEKEIRSENLNKVLQNSDKWVLAGSLCGWGDFSIKYFDLAIFLYLPEKIRIKRLLERERERYGEKISPGGSMYRGHMDFIEWAKKYDGGDENIRSRFLHEKWMKLLACPFIRIEDDIDIDEKMKIITEKISGGI